MDHGKLLAEHKYIYYAEIFIYLYLGLGVTKHTRGALWAYSLRVTLGCAGGAMQFQG